MDSPVLTVVMLYMKNVDVTLNCLRSLCHTIGEEYGLVEVELT